MRVPNYNSKKTHIKVLELWDIIIIENLAN